MKYIKMKNGEIIDVSKYDDFDYTSTNGICLLKKDANLYIEEDEIDEIY